MDDMKGYLKRSYKSAVMDLICAKDENEQFEAKKQMLKLENLGGQSFGFDFMDELHSLYTSKMQEMETEKDATWIAQEEIKAAEKVVEVMEHVNKSLESKDILQELKKKQIDVADLREESNSLGCKCDRLEDEIKKLWAFGPNSDILKDKREQLAMMQAAYSNSIKSFENAEKELFNFERYHAKDIELAKTFLNVPRSKIKY